MSRRRKFWIALVVATWILCELACLAGIIALERIKGVSYDAIREDALERRQTEILRDVIDARNTYLELDPTLGWRVRAGGTSPKYRANAAGIRGDHEYGELPAPGVRRIAAFGDSFTHGDEVTNAETWEAQLEALRPNVEVLNFGVGGYGPDQVYLRFHAESARYHPSIVIFGIMSEDIYRAVNTFRPFYGPGTGFPYAKPRFELSSDALVLIPNPLPSADDYRRLLAHPAEVIPPLGAHDYFFHTRRRRFLFDLLPSIRIARMLTQSDAIVPAVRERGVLVRRYDPASEAYRITLRLVLRFAEEAQSQDAIPIVLFFPQQIDLDQHRAGLGPSYAPLARELTAHNIRVIDPAAALAAFDGRIFGDQHFTPGANGVIARAIAERL